MRKTYDRWDQVVNNTLKLAAASCDAARKYYLRWFRSDMPQIAFEVEPKRYNSALCKFFLQDNNTVIMRLLMRGNFKVKCSFNLYGYWFCRRFDKREKQLIPKLLACLTRLQLDGNVKLCGISDSRWDLVYCFEEDEASLKLFSWESIAGAGRFLHRIAVNFKDGVCKHTIESSFIPQNPSLAEICIVEGEFSDPSKWQEILASISHAKRALLV